MSTRQLGGVLGVDHANIVRWETGEHRPSDALVGPYVEVLERLADEAGLAFPTAETEAVGDGHAK